MTFPNVPPRFFAFLLFLLGLLATPAAFAQVRVDMALNRSLFIRYEPLIAVVTVTNMSGRELQLADDGNHKWFSFHIEAVADGGAVRLVPPYNPDYSLTPVQIGPGESIKRAVNVTPLYPISDFGVYRMRATIYDAQSRRYFSSNPLNIEITEGRVLWEQTVGVPEDDASGGGTRNLTLLTHRLPNMNQLYLRIEDRRNGKIFCTHQLGRTLSFVKPEIQIDGSNQIYILQNTAPKNYLFTRVGLDGQILERKQYSGTNDNRPTLRPDASGGYRVEGGIYLDPKVAEQQKAAPPPPGVSDRPVPLPKSN